MGWGSILGGIASLAAIPFTGGTSLAWLPAAMAGGGGVVDAITGAVKGANQNGAIPDVLGGAAKSAQNQKNIEDYLQLSKANTQLGRDQFALTAPGEREHTAIKSALAAGASPSHVSWGGPGSGLRGELPTYTGGASAALASLKGNPDLQSLLSTIQKDELTAQQKGGASGGNTDAAMPDYLKDVGKSSPMDKLLGGSAFGSSLLSSILKGSGDSGSKGYDTGGNTPITPGQFGPDGSWLTGLLDQDPNAWLQGGGMNLPLSGEG